MSSPSSDQAQDNIPAADTAEVTDLRSSLTPEQQRAGLQNRIDAAQSRDTPILADVGAEVFQAWEAWKAKPENNGRSFQDFLHERKAAHRDHAGKFTADILLAGQSKPETTAASPESAPENDAQGFVEGLLKGKDFGVLVALARTGKLPAVEQAKLDTFSDTYPKSLPEPQQRAFSELWEGLTGKDTLRSLAREQLAKVLDANIQDVVIVEENKVRIENRGQKGDAEVIIKENGDYSVTIAGETKPFLAHQEKELIGFLKGETQ